MTDYILAIDQGTTSSRAILFDRQGHPGAQAQQEFPQHFPADGWVEHDPEELWQSVLHCCRQVLASLDPSGDRVLAIGITNQRETTLVWDRHSGAPLHRAIVWQDRRTADYCRQLQTPALNAMIQAKTGLRPDPYFSASKLHWLLQHYPQARTAAARGDLLFGTVDSFLIWKLTGGRHHRTDASNASRTLLFNIHTQQWDPELLGLFGVPPAMLPEVLDCAADFGHTDAALLGQSIPILGVAGDQQAALFGQACFAPGMVKSTYGTGGFMMLNTGTQALNSQHQLLTTVAWRLKGEVCYALEGSIFVAGAAIQWLRDGLQLLPSAAASEALAQQTPPDHGVWLVPAFTGLGAPYWDPDARGAILGLTRDTGIRELVTAALQAVCYQSRDLQEAMHSDGQALATLRVDGGMSANNWMMQYLADMLGIPVERPHITETTALGAAGLAGLQAGIFTSPEDLAQHWQCQRRFVPQLSTSVSAQRYRGWQAAVARVRSAPG